MALKSQQHDKGVRVVITVKHGIGLMFLFVAAFLSSLVILMPAAFISDRLPQPEGNDTTPQFYGLWWKGQGVLVYEGQRLAVDWELDWHGLTPGLAVALSSAEVNAHGWIGADWGSWRLERWNVQLPAELLNRFLPQGKASGQVAVLLDEVLLHDAVITQVRGKIRYAGGQVSLGEGMDVSVPEVLGELTMQDGAPVLSVTGPNQQSLANAKLQGKTLTLEVFRAFPLLLEMSEGGDATDVVFSTHQEVPVSGGQPG